MEELELTAEQEAVLAAAGLRHGSVRIEAGAGCAKTHTGKLAMQKIRVPGAAFAFNKKIADDLGAAMPGSWECKSFNAWGHGAWARGLAFGTQLKLDDRKVGKLVSEVGKDQRVELDTDQWHGCRGLVEKAQQAGLVPRGDRCEESSLVADDQETWEGLGDELGLTAADTGLLWPLAREVLVRDIALARQGVISFDDQVYCSTMLGGKFPQYPVGFVDEDQDLSGLNIRMVRMSLRPGARLFMVGDKRQGIYAWRGASHTSAEDLQRQFAEGEWQELPLMTTFRCPKAVVARQQGHVPGFRAWGGAATGVVDRWQDSSKWKDEAVPWDGWTYKELQTAAHLAKPNGQPSLAILCRNNGPLLGMAIKLLRQGVGCHMLGRDIGRGLIVLSKKIIPADDTPRDLCRGMIEQWVLNEVSLAQANGKGEGKMEGIYDRGEGLLAVLEGSECRDAGGLRRTLGMIFAKDSGQVTLSTIHRAKGLEWDCVMHLDPWRVPSKWARKAAEAGQRETLEQEYNLRYVCETRTKHTLILADLEGFH